MKQLVLYVYVDDGTDPIRVAEVVESFAAQVAGFGLAGLEAGMCCEPVEAESDI